RHVDGAVAAGDLDADDPRLRRDPGVAAVRVGAVAAHEARHHRSVTEGVDRGALTGEVGAVHDAARQVVHVRDAGVDDRDADAVTEVARAPRGRGAGRLDEVRLRR